MNSRISKIDVILIVMAVVALIGLGVFFLHVSDVQKEQQQQIHQEGVQQMEAFKEHEQLVVAKKELSLSYDGAGVVSLINKSAVELDVSGYLVKINETALAQMESGLVLAPGESHDISLEKSVEDGQNVVSVYEGNGELLYRYLLSELAEQGEAPRFSALSGFYDAGFKLSITAPEGTTIYYTTDGTTPSMDSDVYSEPIAVINRAGEAAEYATKRGITTSEFVPEDVDKCTIVKAIAVDGAGNISEETTGIYFVGLSTKLMYADMPFLVMQADAEELFDYFEGIYVGGVDYENALAAGVSTTWRGNYYNQKTIEASVVMFDADKRLTYKSDGWLGVVADDFTVMGQKSMLFTAKEYASRETFAGTLFYKENASVFFNNGKTDYSIKVRQMVAQDVAKKLDMDYAMLVPCAVFLNGEYWGVYLLEGESKAAIAEKYDILPENVEVNQLVAGENSHPEFQQLYEYIISNDMALQEHYDKVCQRVDIENYADYVCMSMYLANANYGTAVEMWRAGSTGSWRFVLPDMSSSMGIGNVNSFSINSYLYPGVTGDEMLNSLMCNASFRELLQNRMNHLLELTADEEWISSLTAELIAKYRKPMVASFNRYIKSMSDGGFDNKVQDMVYFLKERSEYITAYTDEFVSQEYIFSLKEDGVEDGSSRLEQ